MKNIHIIPTDKPSRLCYDKDDNLLFAPNAGFSTADGKQNIYITNDEEIKEDTKPCWCIDAKDNSINYYQGALPLYNYIGYKKIILTTDADLIKDGVQAIDDEFLEWFVKNPSCEFVEVASLWEDGDLGTYNSYQIIIPQEEPKQQIDTSKYIMGIDPYEKQETLNVKQNTHFVDFSNPNADKISSASTTVKQARFKEAIDRLIELNRKDSFYEGAKWQQEQNKNKYSEEEVIAIVQKSRETGLTAEYLLLTEQFKKK